jgi:hypothetical protein
LSGLVLFLCFLALSSCRAPDAGGAFLQSGDLLFQDVDGGPLSRAIKQVTDGFEGAKFTHVGIVSIGRGRPAVIEASGKGVRVTPLAEFLARSRDSSSRPRVVVGRLKHEYRAAALPAIKHARELVGSSYDDEFLLNNGKFYCAELVYESFWNPASGQRLFEVAPMTFCPPGSQAPDESWREYFARRKLPIPEGRPGCNPGGLSRSPSVEIVYAFGRPEGWSEEVYHRYAALPQKAAPVAAGKSPSGAPTREVGSRP